MAPVEHVVVDTSGFIRLDRLQRVGQNIYTVQEVLNEITHRATQQKLQVLPYDLKVLIPSDEAIEAVEEFAEKTGDYEDLSTTDIKVLALAYMLERQYKGTHHLKKNPLGQIEITSGKSQLTDGAQVAGFFVDHEGKGQSDSTYTTTKPLLSKPEKGKSAKGVPVIKSPSQLPAQRDVVKVEAEQEGEELNNKFAAATLSSEQAEDKPDETGSLSKKEEENERTAVTDGISRSSLDQAYSERGDNYHPTEGEAEEFETVTEEADQTGEFQSLSGGPRRKASRGGWRKGWQLDEEGWITPGNVHTANAQMRKVKNGVTEKVRCKVGCITTDFAMQNVLLQMGLNVITNNGKLLKETRSYVLMCYSCEAKTKQLNKEFCRDCGNKTLRKVNVTIGDDGAFKYFVPYRPPRTPTVPTGKLRDKHGLKHIYTSDQKKPSRKAPKSKESHYGVFDADYITNSSPFGLRDTQSRAAQLGWGRDFDKRQAVTERRRRRF